VVYEGNMSIDYTSADGATVHGFSGTRFVVRTESDRNLQVTYHKKTLEELSSAILHTTVQHGFGSVDTKDLYLSVVGLRKSGIKIPGPLFKVDTFFSKTYDFKGCFLLHDRKFVRSLLSLVFCTSRFSAQEVKVLSLEEHVLDVEYDPTNGQRFIECIYLTGLDGHDGISVIVQGYGTEPNTFTFRPTAMWECKRLEEPLEPPGPSYFRIEADMDMDTQPGNLVSRDDMAIFPQ